MKRTTEDVHTRIDKIGMTKLQDEVVQTLEDTTHLALGDQDMIGDTRVLGIIWAIETAGDIPDEIVTPGKCLFD